MEKFHDRLYCCVSLRSGAVSEEDMLRYREIARARLWDEALEKVQYLRGYRRRSRKQRILARMAERMPLLRKQTEEAWVTRLEILVYAELVLDDAYQAIQWYAAQCVPEMAEYEFPEGGDYAGPGLFWDNIDDENFGKATDSRFWDLWDLEADLR
ncbi:Hypothetical predicted protein, partial [Pelobates cultripes]